MELRKINPILYEGAGPDYEILGYALYLTCYACPEQYDVIKNGEYAGYLRLRHGEFKVHCPDIGGFVVYEANTQGDGIFYDEERAGHLRRAVEAIDSCLKTH
jgi:hypothetical protein